MGWRKRRRQGREERQKGQRRVKTATMRRIADVRTGLELGATATMSSWVQCQEVTSENRQPPESIGRGARCKVPIEWVASTVRGPLGACRGAPGQKQEGQGRYHGLSANRGSSIDTQPIEGKRKREKREKIGGDDCCCRRISTTTARHATIR